MAKILLELSVELLGQLKAYKKLTGIPVNVIIRQAITEYFNKRKHR